MKAIQSGNIFEIFDSSISTYDRLPPQTYIIRFSKNRGFYLEKYVDIQVGEGKVYGCHTDKVQKVMRSFASFSRSLGVILSGNKGIGKSLFARMLSMAATQAGLPVVVVDQYIPGISSYIESIDQEVMILFDEFDKTFCKSSDDDNGTQPQTTMLSLFDGVSGGKKLYVITCNNVYRLNEFLVNRPGRFHYHFRFTYPTPNDIREYLTDKLLPDYHAEIENVVNFSRKVDLSYDCLRAIAYELNSGESFSSAISDLNIVNTENPLFDFTLLYNNGETITNKDDIDLFSDEASTVVLYDSRGYWVAEVQFFGRDCSLNKRDYSIYIPSDKLSVRYNDHNDSVNDLVQRLSESGVDRLIICRSQKDELRYAV